MNRLRIWLLLAALLWISAPTINSAKAQSNSQSDRSAIFAANTRLGRGINLGNFLEVGRHQNWAIPIQVEHLESIKQAGFDSIRLPVKWPDYTDSIAPFKIEEPFAKRIDQFVDKAEQLGLNLVLNIHHFDELDKDPQANIEKFASIWKQLGQRYQKRGSFLYFELNNEPHEKLNDHWNEILKVGLAAVRSTNPQRPVIIGPPFWNGIWALPKLELPKDDFIIVTVHMYNPFEFTHQGAGWAPPEVRQLTDRTFGNAEEIAKVREELNQAATWGRQHNVPIYLGEFGAFSKAPQSSRVLWTETIARASEAHGFSWAYWEFGAGFSVYDLNTRTWRLDLLQALIPKSK